MKLGASQKQRQALISGSSILEDKIQLKEGQNLLRFIQGPQKIRTLFTPVIKEGDDGSEEPGFIAYNYLESGTILERLYAMELEIRNELGEEKPDVGFKSRLNWFYLAIDLKDKANFRVRPINVPKSVKDDIHGMETELDVEDPDYLLNGLYFMYNILVKKTVDPKKPKRYGTKYSASVYGENPFQAIVPATALNDDPNELIEQIGIKEIFTEEMITAIEECNIDLEEVLEPESETQILEKLQKNPINISAKRPNTNDYLYPQVDEFVQGLEQLGIPWINWEESEDSKPTKSASKGIKLSGSKKKEEEPEPEKEEETTDQESENVEETQDKVKTKKSNVSKLKGLKNKR